MSVKHSVSNQKKAIYSMTIGATVGIMIQVVLCAAAVLCVDKGLVSESDAGMFLHVIRVIGVAGTIITVWAIQIENHMIHSAIAVGAVCLVPIMISMMLWGVKGHSVIWCLVIAAATYFLCTWILHSLKSRGVVYKMKKRHR